MYVRAALCELWRLEWFRSCWPAASRELEAVTSLRVSGITGVLRRSPTVSMRAQWAPASPRLFEFSRAHTGPRGIRASFREHAPGVLGDGSQRPCRRLAPAARFCRPAANARLRLSARADWRQPSSGVLADVHQTLCCLMITGLSHPPGRPHFCRARSRPLICNARRHITHHSTARTPAAALAAEARA